MKGSQAKWLFRLDSLPDEIFLKLLQFCHKDDIESSLAYQSKEVRKWTTCFTQAAAKNNHLEIMEWLMKNGCPIPSVFNAGIRCLDNHTMETSKSVWHFLCFICSSMKKSLWYQAMILQARNACDTNDLLTNLVFKYFPSSPRSACIFNWFSLSRVIKGSFLWCHQIKKKLRFKFSLHLDTYVLSPVQLWVMPWWGFR